MFLYFPVIAICLSRGSALKHELTLPEPNYFDQNPIIFLSVLEKKCIFFVSLTGAFNFIASFLLQYVLSPQHLPPVLFDSPFSSHLYPWMCAHVPNPCNAHIPNLSLSKWRCSALYLTKQFAIFPFSTFLWVPNFAWFTSKCNLYHLTDRWGFFSNVGFHVVQVLYPLQKLPS